MSDYINAYKPPETTARVNCIRGPDRTMNTIKAIVDSGVLKNG